MHCDFEIVGMAIIDLMIISYIMENDSLWFYLVGISFSWVKNGQGLIINAINLL